MPRPVRRLGVIAVVAILIAASLSGVAAQQTSDGIEAADEIYVRSNGDAVLRYSASETAESSQTMEFGVSVPENLAYGLLTQTVEDTPEVRGQLSLAASQSMAEGEGGLSLPRPESLKAFSFELVSEVTDQTATNELSLATTVRDESGAFGVVQSISTSGEVTTGPDDFGMESRFDVRANLPLGERESLTATLEEEGTSHTLSIDHERPVDERTAREWNDRERARRLLQQQYDALASQLGGSASVAVEKVSVSETASGFRLRQVYTVRFSGIDSGIESLLRSALLERPDFDREQAERLARAFAAVELRELSLDFTLDGRNLNGSLRVDVRNYAELVQAYLATLERGAGGTTDRLQKRLAAQRAAGLQRTLQWDARLGHPESGVVELSLDTNTNTENRAAYVEELRARNISVLTQTIDVTGAVRDDRLEFEGQGTIEGEELLDTLLADLPPAEELPPESAAWIEGLRDANPDRAKMVGSYDGDGLRLEAGASFENLAALRDALADVGDIPEVTTIVGRIDEGGGDTYVTVANAVSGTPTESTVRGLPYVDAGTTIHLPGTWDRDFPAMDIDRAESFLSDVGPGSSGPGFGVLAGISALLMVGLWIRFRR
ncbi:MAG: hypothetical protein ABEH64_10570 [Salinirussus sp.]